MAKVVFQEEQRFNQWWVIAIFIAVLGIMLRMLVRIIDSGPLDSSSISAIFFGILPIIILSFLFFFTKLKSRIDENGISAVFYPFTFSRKSFQWNEIEKVEVLSYRPLMEYGGWGYRFSGSGRAMNVKGNKGIKIFSQKGKQFLIGTQRPEEAKQVIDSFMKSKSDQ